MNEQPESVSNAVVSLGGATLLPHPLPMFHAKLANCLLAAILICFLVVGLASGQDAPGRLTIQLPDGGKMHFRAVYLGIDGQRLFDSRRITLGSRDMDPSYKERPTEIRLSGGFVGRRNGKHDWLYYLGETEVQKRQWNAVMRWRDKVKGMTQRPKDDSRLPQTEVTIAEIYAYIESLNTWMLTGQRDGLPTYRGALAFCRLPTEAEWAFAARGGIEVIERNPEIFDRPHPYGDDLGDHEWYRGTSGNRVQESGRVAPNPLGLCDMLGNVEELTLSLFSPEYWQGRFGHFVICGGNFSLQASDLSAARRTEYLAHGRDGQPLRPAKVGFRLALSTRISDIQATPQELDAAFDVYVGRIALRDPGRVGEAEARAKAETPNRETRVSAFPERQRYTSAARALPAQTITIQGVGEIFSDLASALRTAKEGDTILIGEGQYGLDPYDEYGKFLDIDMWKDHMSIIGAGALNTVVAAKPTKDRDEFIELMSIVDQRGIRIKGLTLECNYNTLLLLNCADIVIEDCIFLGGGNHGGVRVGSLNALWITDDSRNITLRNIAFINGNDIMDVEDGSSGRIENLHIVSCKSLRNFPKRSWDVGKVSLYDSDWAQKIFPNAVTLDHNEWKHSFQLTDKDQEITDNGRSVLQKLKDHWLGVVLASLLAGSLFTLLWLWLLFRRETVEARAKAETPNEEDKILEVSLVKIGRETFANSICMEFVLIPAGSFTMGSSSVSSYNNSPPHAVKISRPFYLQKTEVSQRQWKEVMGDNPSRFKECGYDCPVERVSWEDAHKFIKKLNEIEKIDKYRLPTEAEWEYAVRAGTTTLFSFGDDEDKLTEYAWYSKNSERQTHRVANKKPNPWGLYDMHGNVWEWVEDDWHWDYFGAPDDGRAWLDEPRGASRVIRGGGWGSFARSCRAAFRGDDRPGYRLFIVGFRLARSVALGP